MNRVYKVIWSKAKHCYVVTSEIAKSHTKGESTGRGLKKLAAALLVAAALMGPNFAWAAGDTVTVKDTSTVEQIVYTKDGADAIFATKTDLDAKANADDVESTYAKTADVANTYVNKTKAEVTYLTVSGDVEAHGTLNVGDGKFIVDLAGMTTTNNATIRDTLTVKGDTEMKGDLGVNGNIKTNRGFIQTGGGNINTQGGALRTNGGNINAGSGLIKTTGTVKAGDVQTGTLTTNGNATIGGALTVTGGTEMKGDLSVKGEFKSETLSSELDKNNYTTINGGKTQSVNLKVDAVGSETQASASTFDENGSNAWAKDDDSIGKSSMTADKISQSLSDKGDNPKNAASRVLSQIADNKYEIADSVVDANGNTNTSTQLSDRTITNIKNGTNESIDLQEVDQIGSSVTDGTNTSVVNQNAGSLIFSITDGPNNTGVTQTATDITNTAKNGTIANEAKNITNHATENMTNTVGGNLTTTVTGDSSLTAENITNEAKNKITNKALDVETDAASSVVSKVSNDYGSNTSTQLSHQTTEEMKAEGKTASYLRGAVEEKSQLIDGGVKTTIDTIAGQTNTNITDGTYTSNDLQKADQIASSVTDDTNTTVVNQNAGSLASSITDGTKFNNTNNTVDKSEQLIKASDTQYSATSKTATKMEDALVSGSSFIDVIKNLDDAANPFIGIGSAVKDGTNITVVTQTAKDITNTAKDGTIANEAKDITNHATENMTNTVDKDLTTTVGGNKSETVTGTSTETVTGKKTENYNGGLETTVTGEEKHTVNGSQTNSTTGDQGNTIGGKQTTTVTGDSSLSAKNITNTATEKLSNSAAEIENSASKSITDKVGANVERTMTTKKISESVKGDDAKSNSFSKTAEKDMNIITDGTNTSTLSQLADKVNTSLKNGTQSLNNTKTVTEDVTKVTDENTGAFSSSSQKADSITSTVKDTEKGTISERSQTVSQVQDKVGTTTVTTTEDLTKLTNENCTHTTEMDYANVTKDLSVYRNTTLGQEGEDTNLTVNSKSEFKDTVKMDSTLEVDGTSTFNDKVTISKNGLAVTGGTTTDTLNVTGETRTGTLHVNGDGYVGGDLNVEGNIETHDAVLSADSRQVVTGRQLYQTNERVDRLDNRIKKVGANAAALAALRPGDFNPDDKFSIAAGFGSYRNANAAALGLFYRPNENVLLSLGTSFGDGENMVNAGVSVKFGRGKSMAERRKEMADEVSGMRDEMRSQDERIAELEEMLKKQSELIEKLSKEA
ncbi:ESPR-type extended signal peptide-containing protein [uncultured Dialister sp.]|uniref:ESPR-type extended signal peptide-containing protein n=1 Tax=uncultured Dialister sp. TaxID=278064 RepID=UPI002602D783|nr:ESPR-type extended signal peptide-containing protein [uncultured Dialister sp.]